MQSEKENSPKKVVKSKRPRLNYDLLVNVCEKFLFSPDNEYRMDLINFSVLNFMFSSKLCSYSWYFHFRRMSKLFVSNGGLELHCPNPIEGRDGITTEPFFQGPFNVNDCLLLLLLQKGQLMIKTVESFYSFADQIPCDSNFATNEQQQEQRKRAVVDEYPAESFIRLFLFRDSQKFLQQLRLQDIEDCELRLRKVKITDNASAFAHLDRILNLSPLQIFIEFTVSFDECVEILLPRVNADPVVQVTLIYSVSVIDPMADTANFPFAHFRSIVNFIVCCCPHLEGLYMRISLDGEFNEEDFNVLSNWLYGTIGELASTTFVGLQCSCNLVIAFHAFFPKTTLQKADRSQHELTQIGQKKTAFEIDRITVPEDVLSDIPTPSENSVAPYIIARWVPIDDFKNITFALVGVREENLLDDWHGFVGPPIAPPPPPVLPLPIMNNLHVEFNGFGISDDDNDDD